jgi:hypothetical protein
MEIPPGEAVPTHLSPLEDAATPAFKTKEQNRDAIYAGAGALGYLLFQLIAARLRLTNLVAIYGAAIISLWFTIGITVFFSRALRTWRSQILCLVLSAAVTLPFVLVPLLRFSTRQQLDTAVRIFGFYMTLFRWVPGLRGILLLSFAVGIGVVLSRLIREVKVLLPVGVVLALIDLYVVFGGGLVSQANSGRSPMAQRAMQSLTVPLTPRPAPNVHAAPVLVGFADFLFIALFFACFVRFGVPTRRTFGLLCGILSVYMLTVIVGSLDLPALVPIAAVVIGSNLGAFRYQRDELFAMLYAGLLLLGILAALVIFSHK